MYGYPQLGNASGDAAMCAAQGNDLARSLKLAVSSGNKQAADMFRAQLRALQARCGTLNAKVASKEMPGAVMRSLDSFSDEALAVLKQFFAGVAGLPKQLGGALPFIAVGAAALGAAYFLSGRKRRK